MRSEIFFAAAGIPAHSQTDSQDGRPPTAGLPTNGSSAANGTPAADLPVGEHGAGELRAGELPAPSWEVLMPRAAHPSRYLQSQWSRHFALRPVSADVTLVMPGDVLFARDQCYLIVPGAPVAFLRIAENGSLYSPKSIPAFLERADELVISFGGVPLVLLNDLRRMLGGGETERVLRGVTAICAALEEPAIGQGSEVLICSAGGTKRKLQFAFDRRLGVVPWSGPPTSDPVRPDAVPLLLVCDDSLVPRSHGSLAWYERGETLGSYGYDERLPYEREFRLLMHPEMLLSPDEFEGDGALLDEEFLGGIGAAGSGREDSRPWLPGAYSGWSSALSTGERAVVDFTCVLAAYVIRARQARRLLSGSESPPAIDCW